MTAWNRTGHGHQNLAAPRHDGCRRSAGDEADYTGSGSEACDQLVEFGMRPFEIAVAKANASAVAHKRVQLVGDGREFGHGRIRMSGRSE